MIRGIVSDFGGVLTTPLFEAFAHVQEQRGVPLEELGSALERIARREGENPLYALERGERREADFLAALDAELGGGRRLTDFSEVYFAGLRPNVEMIAWLRGAAAQRGLRLALLTNNVREWEPRWRAMLPVDELFELVVDSAFVGMRKPDPRIYELTLERFGLPARDCVFLDDLEPNVEAAAALGMHAVRFESTAQAIAELEALLARDAGGP